ncbi:MAG TPA: aminopeptidase P N-terminal domain-containing protein [Longimicrobiales bacterium]|nr:aminopeptidase P N-terminal domain-containing protein [Longimicrobiales bacterium]
MSADVYAARRARILDMLGDDGALIVTAAPELTVGPDSPLRYSPDTDLYYLTGHTEPEAVLVLCAQGDARVTLFVRPRDDERERWSGPRAGVDGARELIGSAAVHPIDELRARLPALVESANSLFAPFDTQRPDVDDAVRAALLHGQRRRPRHGSGPDALRNGRRLIAALRMRKDETELARIREAARITVAAFVDTARRLARPGTGAAPASRHDDRQLAEADLQATLEYGFLSRGAMGPAFPTIVAGGERATILHYESNDRPLRTDELVLIDGGARYRMYCGDISRTFPVSGRFSDAQRALYGIVRAAHAAAVDAVRPGAPAADLDAAAVRVLATGMVELGLLHGSVDDIIEKKEYRRYYPHRTSHWLGLDVHDAGDYMIATDSPLPLDAGMVLTIEPGLYVPAGDTAAPAALRGIGIRLEDDVLVTPAGHEVLTRDLPIEADDVAALLRA